jgi:hypothetical protein
VSSLKGDPRRLGELAQVFRQLPAKLAEDTAKRGAPKITADLQGNFDGGQSAYGKPFTGKAGNALTLKKSGATNAALRFTYAGTVMRTPALPGYARYLIGRYGILPSGRQALPPAWRALLAETARSYKPAGG